MVATTLCHFAWVLSRYMSMGVLTIIRRATTPNAKPNTGYTSDRDRLDFSYLSVIAIFKSTLSKGLLNDGRRIRGRCRKTAELRVQPLLLEQCHTTFLYAVQERTSL